MTIYKFLKIASSRHIPGFVKLAGLAALLKSRRRLIGVFLDPVVACNLRCRMCYFSDDEHRRKILTRPLSDGELQRVAAAFYHRALKLQIGCGAEPTLYPGLARLIDEGKRAGIPFVSITTNGQLFGSGKMDFEELCRAGLDEVTLSMHGTRRETYEQLMTGADYTIFRKSLAVMIEARRRYPRLKLRVNFTVNSLNVGDLADDSFWELWGGEAPDVVQLRPVQNLGDSAWNDFDLSSLVEQYDETFGHIAAVCAKKGVVCVIPSKEQIGEVATEQSRTSALIEDITYCYVAPGSFYKPDFDIEADTFETYHARHNTVASVFRSIFWGKSRHKNTSKKLNYHIK